MDFVVLPPGHGRSVTDFWGWDAHEAQLRWSDDVSGDIGGRSTRRAPKPKFYLSTQTMVTAGILPFRENSGGRAGNRTRDLMISSQRLWPLDHEAGHNFASNAAFILLEKKEHKKEFKRQSNIGEVPQSYIIFRFTSTVASTSHTTVVCMSRDTLTNKRAVNYETRIF